MNRRPDLLITLRVDGKTASLTLRDWCRRFGLHVSTVEDRRKRGWSTRQALITPVGAKP